MRVVLIIIVFIIGFSCTRSVEHEEKIERKQSLLPKAQGGNSDVVVVVEDKYWDKQLKPEFYSIFSAEIKGLYNPESNFDLITISEAHFSDLFKKQKVIIKISIDKKHLKPSIRTVADKYAKGQLYVKITGPSVLEVTKQLRLMNKALLNKLEQHRLFTIQKELLENPKNIFISKLTDKFNARISVPSSFHLVDDGNKTMYFGKKAKSLCESGRNTECYYQMGYLVHELPYVSSSDFTSSFLIHLRDSLTKSHIHGQDTVNPSYMEVESQFPVTIENVIINGYKGVSMRGWWNMKNATMGGPFRCYLLLNKQGNKLYFLDGFVYAPNFHKRDFLMEIDAISNSILLNESF